jgi:MtN3 and saliva related transmembrane protein
MYDAGVRRAGDPAANGGSMEKTGTPSIPAIGFHDAMNLFSSTSISADAVGFVAGFGTTFAALPDLIGMLKRRSSAGMNPRMAGILGLFQVGWVYYGLLIASRPIITWNLIAILINGLSVGAYLYFSRREKSQAPKNS